MLDAGLPAHAFFTTREGGVSGQPFEGLNLAVHVGDAEAAVAENRAAVELAAGVPVAYIAAEHGARVHRVVDPRAPVPPADILVTDTPGVGLAVLGADCVPLVLYDAATGAVAVAHVGRKGLWIGAVDAAIAALLDLRATRVTSELISASVGPAICGKCYEVPREMMHDIAQRHPTARSTTRRGTPALDIPRAVETRLGELGVGSIGRVGRCTCENSEFFSHRRDGLTGRQAGVIVCGVSLREGR